MGRAGGVIAALAFVGVAAAAVAWGPGVYDAVSGEAPAQRCTVEAVSGTYSLSVESANNAAIVAAAGWNRGYDERGVTVALATAIQESGLRNLDYGDRDSVGLFQQRTSQGWGTVEQIMDPRYASTMFYSALARVDGWDSLPLTEAAQAVQRSGFPDAYGYHEAEARAWANALGGVNGSLTCDLTAASPTTPEDLTDRLHLDFPDSRYAVEVLGQDGDTTILGIRPPEASDALLRRVRSWAIATAATTSVEWADYDGTRWSIQGGAVSPSPTTPWAGYPGVLVGLKTR